MPQSNTPLRRVSSGALSQSNNTSVSKSSNTQHPLDFLLPALNDLSDELDGIHSSTKQLFELDKSLYEFNKGFSSLLWALKLNAYCISWPHAPNDDSFNRVEELNNLLQQSMFPKRESTPIPVERPEDSSVADKTYTTQIDEPQQPQQPQSQPQFQSKPQAKPKPKVVSVQLRKRREAFVDSVIESLPLEYRGSQPVLRNAMVGVLNGLMRHKCTTPEDNGIRVPDLVKQPDLPQAKVNKCLIALVQKKSVVKWTENGVAYYRLQLDVPK